MVSIRSTLRCHYRYDPLDRLIDQTQPDAPMHQRFYCKSRLATEIQGAIHHSIIQHGDLLLAQGRRQGDLIETALLATDLQRSVLQTLKANQPGQPIAYCPYGHHRAESGLTSLLGFNGERPDPVTGHYLLGNGYRAFNPVLMRFNSPDSWSPFGKGGLNAYAYCKGNPISESDPTGHANMVKVVSTLKIGLKRSLNRARARLAVPSGKPQMRPNSPPASYSAAPQTLQGAENVPPSRAAIAQPIGEAPLARPPAYSLNDPFPSQPLSTPEVFYAPARPPNYFEATVTAQRTDRVPTYRNPPPEMDSLDLVNQPGSQRPASRNAQIRQGLNRAHANLDTLDQNIERLRQLLTGTLDSD